MIRRLLCRILSHDWTPRYHAVPEDRDSYRCDRCKVWGYNPARVGEREVKYNE